MADPKVKLKRSAVEGKIPTPDQLPLGEIALNTYDKKLFASANVGVGTTVFTVNPWTVGFGTNVYDTYFTAGNVGVGTTRPGASLHVTPTSTNIAGLFSGSTSGDMVRITQTGSGNALIVEDEANPDTTPFVVTGIGSVGIGTINPTQRLTVQGLGSPEVTTNLSGSDIRFTNTSSTSTIGGSISSKLGRSWSSLTSLQTEVLSLLPVDVNDSVTGGLRLIADGTVGAANRSALVLGGYYSGLADDNAITIRGTGLVGVNTATPTSKLHVVGDTLITGVATASGGFNLGISSAGTVITSGPVKTLNFVGAGNTFLVNGTTVDISISGGGGATISDTPPSSAISGDLWWESDTGILKIYYDDGTSQQWVDASGINQAGIFSRVATSVTATGGQTTFNVTYTVGYLDVYVNGVLLSESDYTATDGTSVVLTEAANEGDVVIFIAFGSTGSAYWNKNSNEDLYTLSNVGVGTSVPRFDLEVGSVGAASTSLWVNGDARVTGILSVGQGTITLDGNNNKIGIGTANIQESLHVVGNVLSTGTVYGSGNVIQVGFSTSPGSSTTNTVLVNSQGVLSTFTPKRSDSTIHQIWTFQTITSTVVTTNTVMFFAIAEGNTNTRLVSPVYTAYSIEASDGNGMASTASIQVSVASTGTSTRSFSVFFRSNTATNTVYATDIRCTFIEVAP